MLVTVTLMTAMQQYTRIHQPEAHSLRRQVGTEGTTPEAMSLRLMERSHES
jgi:hypothetical protein